MIHCEPILAVYYLPSTLSNTLSSNPANLYQSFHEVLYRSPTPPTPPLAPYHPNTIDTSLCSFLEETIHFLLLTVVRGGPQSPTRPPQIPQVLPPVDP